MTFDALFVNPNGRTTRDQYLPALVTVLASIAFFSYIVPGRTSQFCMWVLMYPLFVLLARRLHDLSKPAWLLLAPLALTFIAFANKLGYLPLPETLKGLVGWVAVAATAVFVVWGGAKK